MVAAVGTSTNTTPLDQAYQKRCFYANGRWWAWYYDGSNFGWKTSIDGIDWSGAFTAYGAYAARHVDVWYNEANNKICLARRGFYYRQGTANSDGSISWDSDEVLVVAESGYNPVVCKDSEGYPWVSYGNVGKTVKATATDGSSWGAVTTLWDVGAIKLVPLTGGKMLAISCANGRVLQSRLFNGASWEDIVNASVSTPDQYYRFDAVADGDNVHLIFLKATSLDIVYVKYVYGTGWGSEETVESATIAINQPSIILKSADKVRVAYIKSQTEIKYRDRDEGAWQTAVTISSTESTMTGMASSNQTYSSKFGVIWKSGAASPYNVNIETYTLGVVAVAKKIMVDGFVSFVS